MGMALANFIAQIFAASLSVANQTKAEDPPIDHN